MYHEFEMNPEDDDATDKFREMFGPSETASRLALTQCPRRGTVVE